VLYDSVFINVRSLKYNSYNNHRWQINTKFPTNNFWNAV
jgi:hypothetical protein